jgi:hypothetical protein
MKRAGLLLAVMLVIIANLIALSGVWYNRGGAPSSVITITERELPLFTSNEDDSGVALRMKWLRADHREPGGDDWLDRAKLEELGFDCPPTGLEHDIRDWRKVLVVIELQDNAKEGSTLAPVDAGLDHDSLRRMYSDRERHIIAPGVVQMRHNPDAERGKKLTGRIQYLLPAMIHVPKVHAGYLSGLEERSPDAEGPPRYAVTLRYGRRLEPWVIKVEPLTE